MAKTNDNIVVRWEELGIAARVEDTREVRSIKTWLEKPRQYSPKCEGSDHGDISIQLSCQEDVSTILESHHNVRRACFADRYPILD